MAKVAARNSYIRLGTRDFSGDANSVEFPRAVDMVEVSAFGNSYKQFVEGLQDSKINVNAWWDNGTAAADLDATLNGFLQGGNVRWDYAPGGSASNRPYYSGTALMAGYSINGAVAGAVAASVQLQGTGTVVRGIIA